MGNLAKDCLVSFVWKGEFDKKSLMGMIFINVLVSLKLSYFYKVKLFYSSWLVSLKLGKKKTIKRISRVVVLGLLFPRLKNVLIPLICILLVLLIYTINTKNGFIQLPQRFFILDNGLFNFSTAFCTNWHTFFYWFYIRTNIVQYLCRRYVVNNTRKRMSTICRWYNIKPSM